MNFLLTFHFTNGDCEVLHGVLSNYEKGSGQCINLAKSSVFFSANVKPPVRAELMAKLGITRIMAFERYLGLPLMFGRAITKEYDAMKKKIVECLES